MESLLGDLSRLAGRSDARFSTLCGGYRVRIESPLQEPGRPMAVSILGNKRASMGGDHAITRPGVPGQLKGRVPGFRSRGFR
jgi:hypothetical protein